MFLRRFQLSGLQQADSQIPHGLASPSRITIFNEEPHGSVLMGYGQGQSAFRPSEVRLNRLGTRHQMCIE
jgi:hypothetical protein